MTRAAIFAEFDRASVQCDGGLAFRTDDAIERLYHFWRTRGAKPGVIIGIDTDAQGNELMIWIEDHNPQSPGVTDVASLF